MTEYYSVSEYLRPLILILQVAAAYVAASLSWPLIILAAYVFGGTINHSMSLAIHEISHNLAFGHSRPMANRFLGIFGNVIIGLPTSITFKRYHLEHHKYQGIYHIVDASGSALAGGCARMFRVILVKPAKGPSSTSSLSLPRRRRR